MVTERHRDIDKGWAWWVLFASYLNLLLCSGLSYVAGMFQVVFLEEFHGSVALTSWVTSLFSSFMQLGGPVSSFVANIASCRAAVMVGGVCLSVGLALSALQNSLGMLFAFFGIVAGIGLGLTYTASVVVISYYFHQRRTMVTGIALSSGGLGIMLGPQMSTLLFNMFSWREALGIMSVISAQVCVLGALMFPMHETERSPLVSRIHRTFNDFFSLLCGKCRGKDKETKDGQHFGNGTAIKLMKDDDQMESRNHNGEIQCLTGDSGQNGYRAKSDLESECTTELWRNVRDSSSNPTEEVNGTDPSCNAHMISDHLADVNNSSSSLRIPAHNDGHRSHYHHHHYFLKQHHHHNHDHVHSHSNLHHSHKTHTKTQSYYELSTSPDAVNSHDHYQLRTLNQTFRSNRELHLKNSSDHHSSEREIHSSHIRPLFARNFNSPEHKRSELSSSRQASSERLGQTTSVCHRTGATDSEAQSPTALLHLKVVPHNPSLLSLAGSMHHLDLVFHKDNQPSSTDTRLDSKDQLYKGLFGIDKGKASELGSSRNSLRSAQSKTYIPVTDPKSAPNAEELETNLVSSTISLSHAHNHVSGKDPNRPLYHNGAFILLCVQLFVANCACGVFNIHMPSFTMSKGLSDQEVTNILSINGLALFNGRMLVGALASATGFDLLIYWALHMIGGLFIIILPVAGTSYLNFCLLIYGVGTFFGSVYSVLTSLTLKYVGLSRLATAFGLEMVSAGLGYLLAPPVAGLLVDLTGSYDYDMYCGGALLILSALILMFLPILEPEVTREDIRLFMEGNHRVPESQSPGGIEVEVEVQDCTDCRESKENCTGDV